MARVLREFYLFVYYYCILKPIPVGAYQVHLAQDEVEKIATTSKLLPREKVALSTMAKYAYAPLSVVSVMFLLLCFPF